MRGLDDLLASPPLVTKSEELVTSSVIAARVLSVTDPFTILPSEIRVFILGLLPTASIRAIQLASRSMASHAGDEMIWMPRFDFPHEFSHISKSYIMLRSDENKIDWPLFRHALLDPEDLGFNELRWWWDSRQWIPPSDLQWWKNRQRIRHIVKPLAEKLHAILCPDFGASTKLGIDPFATAPFRRKVIRNSPLPTTKRDHVNFVEGLKLNEISAITYHRKQPPDSTDGRVLGGRWIRQLQAFGGLPRGRFAYEIVR